MVRGVSLEEYRHPTEGFIMPVPSGWQRVEDAQDGVALIVVEPAGQVGFRANLVVTVEPMPLDPDLDSWQTDAEEMLPQQLPHYALIDRERIDKDGREILRRLAHYVTDDTGPVTMEQWSMIEGGRGFTITCSVASLSYDSLADVFSEMALGFRTEPRAAS